MTTSLLVKSPGPVTALVSILKSFVQFDVSALFYLVKENYGKVIRKILIFNIGFLAVTDCCGVYLKN